MEVRENIPVDIGCMSKGHTHARFWNARGPTILFHFIGANIFSAYTGDRNAESSATGSSASGGAEADAELTIRQAMPAALLRCTVHSCSSNRVQ